MEKQITNELSRPKADQDEKLSLGKNIQKARCACGFSRPQLAKLMGITLGGVSSWEYGRTRPDFDSLKRLCTILKVSSDSLLDISPACDDITQDERSFLNEYRRLPQNEKRYIEGMVKMMNQAAEPSQVENATEIQPKIITLPLNSLSMCAGDGMELDYVSEPEYVRLIECDTLKDCDELVKVSGSSMEPAFYDGDLALVKHMDTLSEGDIGVFVIDGEGMIKQYKKDGLHPLNKKYKVIHPDPFASFKCFGKVIGKVTEDMLP